MEGNNSEIFLSKRSFFQNIAQYSASSKFKDKTESIILSEVFRAIILLKVFSVSVTIKSRLFSLGSTIS